MAEEPHIFKDEDDHVFLDDIGGSHIFADQSFIAGVSLGISAGSPALILYQPIALAAMFRRHWMNPLIRR